MEDGAYIYQNHKPKYEAAELDLILQHAESCGGFSDIYFNSNKQVIARTNGKLVPITCRPLSFAEVKVFTNKVAGDGAAEGVINSREVDDSYEVPIPGKRKEYYRYRVNVVGIRDSIDNAGLGMTFRSIDGVPKTLDELNVDPVIRENTRPRQGLIVVSGETGSGKSTLLAAIIDGIAKEAEADKVILTYEAPIEYVYDHIDNPKVVITQSSVKEFGGHVKSFAEGIRGALRRGPNVILVGEARDKETISTALLASETGHLCFTTSHANGVVDTISRMADEMDQPDKAVRKMIRTLKGVINQFLARRIDGGLIAVQEYLFFTPDIVKRLEKQQTERVLSELQRCIEEFGQTYEKHARKLLEQNIISEDTYKFIIN